MLTRNSIGTKLSLVMKLHFFLIKLNMDGHPKSNEYPKKVTAIVKKYNFGVRFLTMGE
jgi:hypothetical protein